MPKGDQVIAVRNPDGNYTLKGMRIFHALGKGSNGDQDFDVSEEWCQKAVAKSRARFDLDGYAAPTTIFHRSTGKAIGAGTFVAQAVESIEYEGKAVPTILADVTVKPEVYAQIKRGELPFRSVEILDYNEFELSGLALLPDREPFCKYGLLGITETVGAAEANTLTVATFERSGSLQMFARSGKRGVCLFKFEQQVEEKKPGEKEEKTAEHEEKPVGEEKPETPGAGDDDSVKENPDEAADDGAGKGEGATDVTTMFAKIVEMIRGLLQLKNAFAGTDESRNPGNQPKPPVEMERQPKEQEPPMPNPETVTVPKTEFDALKARVDKVESSGAEFAKSTEVRTRVDAAKAKLRGVNLSSADEADILEFATNAPSQLDRFVNTLVRRGNSDGPRTAEDAFGSAGEGNDGDPAEVAEFAAKGADQLSRARTLYRSWKEATDRGGMTAPLKKYLEINMNPDAHVTRTGPKHK